MIIYTDSEVNPEELFGTRNVTPAHLHLLTKDFSTILDDLASGKIPTGTGQPFDVNWDDEKETENPPWIKNTIYQNNPSDGFFNPWQNI